MVEGAIIILIKAIVISVTSFENISERMVNFLSVFTTGLFNNWDKSLFWLQTDNISFISERVDSKELFSITKLSRDFAYLDVSFVAFIFS